MNATELQDYYIHLLMETLSKEEHAKENERLKYILGAHPKPLRSETGQIYVDFVAKNIYSGNTAFDILKKKFSIETENANYDYWMEKTGLSKEELQKEVNDCCSLAKERIKEAFKKHSSKLNKILNKKS